MNDSSPLSPNKNVQPSSTMSLGSIGEQPTWRDDDAVGFLDDVNGLVDVDLGVSADDLHGLPTRSGSGAVPAQDHIGQGAVHRLK